MIALKWREKPGGDSKKYVGVTSDEGCSSRKAGSFVSMPGNRFQVFWFLEYCRFVSCSPSSHPSDTDIPSSYWTRQQHESDRESSSKARSILLSFVESVSRRFTNKEYNSLSSPYEELIQVIESDDRSLSASCDNHNVGKPTDHKSDRKRFSNTDAGTAAIASLTAAVGTCALLHPLDLIKTRMQGNNLGSLRKADPHYPPLLAMSLWSFGRLVSCSDGS